MKASPNRRIPLLVAERLPQRGAQNDRGVLDGVVAFDVDIALGGDRQIKARMGAQRGQHVVEERHTGMHADVTGAVEVEFDDDVGLAGLALDLCGAAHGAPMWASSEAASRALAARKASFSSANPIVVRKYPGMPTSRIRTPSSR